LRKAVVDGDIENGSLMAGQSVSLVKKIQPVRDILNEIVNQASQQLTNDKKAM
jgi:enoyl-[acyl-carrier protein] reductase II